MKGDGLQAAAAAGVKLDWPELSGSATKVLGGTRYFSASALYSPLKPRTAGVVDFTADARLVIPPEPHCMT